MNLFWNECVQHICLFIDLFNVHLQRYLVLARLTKIIRGQFLFKTKIALDAASATNLRVVSRSSFLHKCTQTDNCGS